MSTTPRPTEASKAEAPEPDASAPTVSSSWIMGLGVAVLTAGSLSFAILTSARVGQALMGASE